MGMGPRTLMAWQVGLIVSLFFLWGGANSLNDILIKQFQKAFTLGDMQASLVQSAFYGGYFFGALPAARVACAHGYKASILLGLGLFCLGALLFFPASRNGGSFPAFLGCLYLIAFGLAFLESSANPWIVLLGDDHKKGGGTRALNLAQSFNPLGAISGVLLGRLCILGGAELTPAQLDALGPVEHLHYRQQEAAMVGPPYVFLGFVVAAVAVAFSATPFPGSSGDGAQGRQLTPSSLVAAGRRLWRDAAFAQGMLSQFAYCGGQVCTWSFLIRYVQASLPGVPEQRAADFILVSLLLFVAGRFVASGAMCVFSESQVLATFAMLASACCVVAALAPPGALCVSAVCAVSFFMGMMFPTIFGVAIGSVDRKDTEVGAAFLVMCIVGGATIAPVMGLVSDATSIHTAYLVPGACFFIVALYALQHVCGRFQDAEGESRQLL